MERPKAKASEPSTDSPNDPNRYQRSQRTYEEARTQGEAIRRSLEAAHASLALIVHRLSSRRFNKVYILGCGDSWFVGMGIRLAFERLLKVPTESMQALDYAHYYYGTSGPDTLAIGISSSGNTPAVMNALRRAKGTGAITIGVTNTENSPISQEFDESIYIQATRQGWPTQASTAAMAVLIRLALELARLKKSCPLTEIANFQADLHHLPDLVDHVVEVADKPTQELAHRLGSARFFLLCAGGPFLAAAAFGAAKIKELCPIHAMVIPLEEFHHYRSLKPGDPLFLIAPDNTGHTRALETAEVGRYDGGQIFALLPEDEQEISSIAHWVLKLPKVHEMLAPIVYSVPLHLFAYHLAMEKFERRLGHTNAFPEMD